MSTTENDAALSVKDIRRMFRCTSRAIRTWCRYGVLMPIGGENGAKKFKKTDVIRALTMNNDRYRKMLEYANREDWEDSFTTTEVARMLGVSRPTAERWVGKWMVANGQTRTAGAWARLTRTQVRLLARSRGVPVKWPTDDEMLMGVHEAARYLGVGAHKLWRLDRSEMLIAAHRTPKGQLRYTKAQLRQYADLFPKDYPFAVKSEVL